MAEHAVAAVCASCPAVGMVVLGTFTTELFATPIRASAMGVFNEAGRLGSIIAPLMLMVGAAVRPSDAVYVPFLAFGLVALLAGLLTLVLPETLGAPMAENIDVSGEEWFDSMGRGWGCLNWDAGLAPAVLGLLTGLPMQLPSWCLILVNSCSGCCRAGARLAIYAAQSVAVVICSPAPCAPCRT